MVCVWVFYLETSYYILIWHAALSCNHCVQKSGRKTQFHIRDFTPTTDKDIFFEKAWATIALGLSDCLKLVRRL
jgi:hypothetical protein